MKIRAATRDDWPAIWQFLRQIVRAGDTFTWDPDVTEPDACALWMKQTPGRTIVATDDAGTVMGTAETHPNQGGGGSHIANAGFMVDPAYGQRGVGRALAKHVITAARADGYRAIVFNAVAATNLHAVRLYEDLGFSIIATVPEGFRHPTAGYVGLHIMHRPL
ncbi:MAG: GNAT family N-acetyltransferase [Actinomycetota bacterium]|nr:GNAT family N-acetyltransferase [Actinomycetota bacterium]